MFGFVIVRHVTDETTNKYWVECVRCIRKHYPIHPIMIVDDASEFVNESGVNMTNIRTVQSEYPKRGELLGYYYFHKLKPFDTAMILHDSMFIQKNIHILGVNTVAFLWEFSSEPEFNNDPNGDIQLLNTLKNNDKLVETYMARRWTGCFGTMSVISHTFLDTLVNKYDLFQLLDHVKSRPLRMNLERVFGVVCSLETQVITICGNIFNHPGTFNLTFDTYMSEVELAKKDEYTLLNINPLIRTAGRIITPTVISPNRHPMFNCPIIKVWTGR